MGDGSTPTTHATQAAWLLQDLVNTSLSTYPTGPQSYSQAWAHEVLAENFVQINRATDLHCTRNASFLLLPISSYWPLGLHHGSELCHAK